MIQTYPLNPISEISKERCSQFQNKINTFDKGLCPEPRSGRRRKPPTPTPAPPPDAPIVNVIGEIGSFEDENGDLKPGLKFNCLAKQKNVLFINSQTPVFGRVFYGKYGVVKFTLGANENYYQTPEKINFIVGDEIFSTTENGSFLTGEVNHPTEFWIVADEDPEILKDNKLGFEFILFFYSEQNSKYVFSEINKLLKE